MSSSELELGKRVYELDELTKQVKSDSYLIISQDDLTRKVTINNLKLSFNGDKKDPSYNDYYSTQKIEEKLSAVYERMLGVEQDVFNINKKFGDLQNTVNQVNNDLVQRVNELDVTINERIDDLEGTVNNNYNALNQSIDIVNTTLGGRITALENKLTNITGIEIGTSVPTTLASGKIYLQYF